MQLTALVENTLMEGRTDLQAEFGLSLHVESEGKQLIFDCGKSGVFADNASSLGIDLAAADACVISHRHYDHFNGVEQFLKRNVDANVYVRQNEPREYFFKAFLSQHDVGINEELFEQYPARFTTVTDTVEILPDVFLLPDICKEFSRPSGNKYLYVKNTNGSKRDEFDHEMIMVVKEEDGLILFSGCAHSGIVNMLETTVRAFPDAPIKAVVGGFHLMSLPIIEKLGGTKREVLSVAEQLKKYPVGKFYTGHCTGLKGFSILQSVLGDQVEYLATGRSVTV